MDCNYFSIGGVGAFNMNNGVVDQAFYNCGELTSVVLPDSMTKIGEWMFYNCSRSMPGSHPPVSIHTTENQRIKLYGVFKGKE